MSADDYLQMSPHHESVIFSPTRPKDTPTLILTAHDGTISDVLTTPQMTTTSFTFPDTVVTVQPDEQEQQQQQSPTIRNNLDTGSVVKQRNKKNGMEPLPEEIPMLSNSNYMDQRTDDTRITMDDYENHQPYNNEGNNSSSGLLARTLKLNNIPTPIPSPRHHIAETRMSTDDDLYVNTKKSGPFLINSSSSGSNSNSKMVVDAFSNPSYQILNKTVPTHHHNGN